jgi:hypothetical protein
MTAGDLVLQAKGPASKTVLQTNAHLSGSVQTQPHLLTSGHRSKLPDPRALPAAWPGSGTKECEINGLKWGCLLRQGQRSVTAFVQGALHQ